MALANGELCEHSISEDVCTAFSASVETVLETVVIHSILQANEQGPERALHHQHAVDALRRALPQERN